MTCKDCRFYCVDGTCRRFPPAGRPSCWPTLNANDWCGEFEAKKIMTNPQEIPYVDINVAQATPREIEPGGLQALEEGVAPKVRFQRKKPAVSDLKEIQETPLFGGE